MIFVRYELGDPSVGARWEQQELRGDDLVVIRERHEGAFFDESLAIERATGWGHLRYVLDGPLVTRGAAPAVELRAQDALVSAAVGDAPVRALTTSTDVLHVAWRAGSDLARALRPASGTRLGLSPLSHASLRQVAESLRDADPGSTSPLRATRAMLEALRAEGLPFDPSALAAARPVLADEHEVARALERVTFPLSRHPTSVDLARALGVTESHALRRVNRYFRRFHRCVGSWRDYLRGQRVMLGAFFMARRDARTESVARVLGFRSPTSFCHAFDAAGLPSPRVLQRALVE